MADKDFHFLRSKSHENVIWTRSVSDMMVMPDGKNLINFVEEAGSETHPTET